MMMEILDLLDAFEEDEILLLETIRDLSLNLEENDGQLREDESISDL